MAGTARVTDRDRGYRKMRKRVADLAKAKGITVGIHSDAGGESVAVASVHEFGLGNVPERSFVRSWADSNKSKHADILRKLGIGVVRGENSRSAMEKAGLVLVADMRQNIRGGIDPENAPATIARKGSSTPLIDTGQLVSSISHKVE